MAYLWNICKIGYYPNILDGGFHSHGGTPIGIAGWLMSRKIPIENRDGKSLGAVRKSSMWKFPKLRLSQARWMLYYLSFMENPRKQNG